MNIKPNSNNISIIFRNGIKQPYGGGRTKDEIIQWVTKKSGPPSTLVTCDELKNEATNLKYILVYFGPEDHALFKDVFEQFADS